MGVAMEQGRRAALTLAAGSSPAPYSGHDGGNRISALLTRYAEALIVLKIFGGLYLLWLLSGFGVVGSRVTTGAVSG
jgi:threonine/homoserine/homoserine lactone efflux protein